MKDKRKRKVLELEKIKKKINKLDQQFSKLILNQGAYFMALLDILKEEGLLKDDRFKKEQLDQWLAERTVQVGHKPELSK